jgi:hypothetical protein
VAAKHAPPVYRRPWSPFWLSSHAVDAPSTTTVMLKAVAYSLRTIAGRRQHAAE